MTRLRENPSVENDWVVSRRCVLVVILGDLWNGRILIFLLRSLRRETCLMIFLSGCIWNEGPKRSPRPVGFDWGPVSWKSRNFSGAFRVTYLSLYLQNEGVSRHETLQLFNFYSLYSIWKDRLCRISGSEFYEWLFGPKTFSELSRNGPRDCTRFYACRP